MRRTLALAAALALRTRVAADGDAPLSDAPVAALPPAIGFVSLVDESAPPPATVSPSPEAVDDAAGSATSFSASSSSSATAPARESPFQLVLSASSNDAVDLLEIVRASVADAPRVSFESMTNKSAWDVDKWENPLTLLSNMITNEHIEVAADGVRLAVQLTDPAKATSVNFAKTNAWHYGPTLVLGDNALDGLSRIKQLAFSNFNVSFEGAKWLPPDTTLKKLVFNQSTIATFSLGKEYTVLRAEFRDSVLSSFPSVLLDQATFPEALTFEACTFSEPLKLSAEELLFLQNVPSVTFSQNTFPDVTPSDCAQTALYEGATVCLTTRSTQFGAIDTPEATEVSAPAKGNPTPSVDLPTLPPPTQPTPLSHTTASSSRGMLHTLVGVLCVVGGIALVAGFVFTRRRQAARAQHDYELSLSTHSDKFLDGVHGDDSDEDVERGLHRGTAYSQRETTVGMGFLSDVDLGRQAIVGETRLGANGLWRADYRGETVAALRVNVESLRERGLEIESVVASCVALRHPYVVEFLGTSMASADEMWLVAEFMAKGSLRAVMFKKKITFTWGLITRMSLQLASALAFVQSTRDSTTRVTPTLSSRSVLCDGEHNCKLDVLEFATSTRDHDAPVLSYGQGEIAYRAPELLRSGNASHLPSAEAAAAEVYALGAVLCELTFQTQLYSDIVHDRGVTAGEIFIAREVAAGRLRPAPAADAPHEYARTVDACVAYDPADRPTAAEIVERLTKLTA